MAIVVFDPDEFKTLYPEFAAVADGRLDFFFLQACIYFDNTDACPVQDIGIRTALLNMLTAHIGSLSGALNPGGTPNPVGRGKQAQEGSVQGEFEFLATNAAQWFNQTQYGAAFWQATINLRSMRYIGAPCYYGFGFNGFWNPWGM
jgi:hypothetical protein